MSFKSTGVVNPPSRIKEESDDDNFHEEREISSTPRIKEESDDDNFYEEREISSTPPRIKEESDDDNFYEEREISSTPRIKEESDDDNFYEEREISSTPPIKEESDDNGFYEEREISSTPRMPAEVTYVVENTWSERGRSGVRRRHNSGTSDGAARFRSRSPCKSTTKVTGAWKTEADPDVAPEPPRFAPKRSPGVQPPLNIGNPSPIEIFTHFFDVEVLKVLCKHTNMKAERNLEKGKKFVWTEISPQEMKKYLGMLLYMAVLHLPKVRDFWRKDSIFHLAFPATVMPRDRFLAIYSNLHMSNPSEDAENDRKIGTKDYDPLHRVRPLYDMLRTQCMTVYHPRQHIAVDERMVATKARLSIKQYMKAKPTKWGLKFFVVADVNGYTIDYRLYTGKSKFASGKGLPFDVVTSLVNKDFLGSGYIVYCDNYYTSPELFRHLSRQGFGACGTYRQGHVGVPSPEENAVDKRSPRGTIRWIRDGDLLFVKWIDTREVSICTNVHPVYTGESVLRWQKTADRGNERVTIPRPTAITEYNKYMGGVDTSDQMLWTNSVHRKTRRWTMTVFQHLLDVAITNSYIIHKEIRKSQQRGYMTRQTFQEQLCAQLLGVPLNARPVRTPSQGHFPVPVSDGQGHDRSQRASMGRQRCTLCKRSTPWRCGKCGVGLCLQLDRNCFRMYHLND
ncbi:piggyBac transposable element-derived protein 4-like isoform X3 [Myripristis murdjan]|uniref:piggyBac transposable element-derived protein 4-like isoform X3 n=1 Tax=Myripristis murdjan TaxID=586833 RepID=UPI001175CBFC|nr:piggyBac transposable element-derived protein 4-like isoform X3 [Myripristis murdjan]